jgi:glycoside/pentoside/hexuronide:cation symporter, GPH family
VEPKIAPSRLLRYSSYTVPVVAVTVPITGYLPAFYNEVAGISLTDIGVAFFVLRMFDFALDLFIAMAVDSQPWRQGIYRPWLILSVPILLAGVWLMYMPDPDWLSVPYILAAGLVTYTGYTIANITHQAWGAEAVAQTGQLEQFFGFRELAVITGIMTVALVPAVAESFSDVDLAARVESIGVYLLVSIVLFGMLAIGAIPDHQPGPRKAGISFAGVKLSLGNSSLRAVVAAKVLIFFAIIGSHSMLPFLSKSYFHYSEYYSRLLALYFGCAFIGVFFWLRLAGRLGDLKVLRIASAYLLLAHVTTIALASHIGGLAMYALHFGAMGIGFGAIPMLLRSTAGLIAQYFESRKAVAVRGVVFGLITVAEKLGSATAVAVALPLMDLLDLKPGGDNSSQTLTNVLMAYILLPALGYGLTLFAVTRIRSEHLCRVDAFAPSKIAG